MVLVGMSLRTALWVIPVSDLAGVARHAEDAMPRIPGYQCVALCPPGPLSQQLAQRGVPVVTRPFGPNVGLATSLRSLQVAVREVQPDVAHSHLAFADIALALAAPRALPLVSTEHGIARHDLVYHRSVMKSRVMQVVHRVRVRRFSTLIAVSQATADVMQVKWQPAGQIRVIRNGIDSPTESGSRQPKTPGLRILSLARLAPEKQIDQLISSFVALLARQPSATLKVCGTGPLHQLLQAQVQRLELTHAVKFPGFVEARLAMQEADVVAMLSTWENCPYALLDAQAGGLGVVASPVGGIPEILPDHCLIDPQLHQQVASKLQEQGTQLSRRPTLDNWPTLTEMSQAIAATYDDVVTGR
jgi:glycogen synthase